MIGEERQIEQRCRWRKDEIATAHATVWWLLLESFRSALSRPPRFGAMAILPMTGPLLHSTFPSVHPNISLDDNGRRHSPPTKQFRFHIIRGVAPVSFVRPVLILPRDDAEAELRNLCAEFRGPD
jgi:hypothetical protein